jgi:hypothetical protein
MITPGCVTGALPQDDLADHVLWTIDPGLTAQRWDVGIAVSEGAPAILAISQITSDPAAPTLTLDPQVTELRTAPDVADAALRDLWLRPGRYLITVGPGGLWTGTPSRYRIDVQPGSALPASADQEPNDDATTATPIATAFELSGDAATTDDFYAWQADTTEPGLWAVELQGAMGTSLAMTLSDASGLVEGDVRSLPDGTARLPDLDLDPGLHTIRVVGTSDPQSPYILRAYRTDLPFADPEPNDDPARALPIAPGELMAGRLARPYDWDAYRLSVDEDLGSVLVDARLITQSGPPRRLCLYRLTPVDGAPESSLELSCVEGPTGGTLDGLLLQPGDYQLVVAGAESLVDPYYLRVDRTVAPQRDFELEPNDTPALATPVDSGTAVRGRLDNTDVFKVHVTGEPQLWQAEARGSDAHLTWIRSDGMSIGTGTDPSLTREHSVISDAYLIPGDHWFRVDGTGEYTLALESMGPPIPGGEREPNESLAFANTLAMDDSITGRISSIADRDTFRFSLPGPEHVKVTLEAPHGGSYQLLPNGDMAAFLSSRKSMAPGEPIELDLVLPAGDHALDISGPATEERYRLSLGRLDPYDLAVDQEPNDEAAAARPMPPSLWASGRVDAGDGADWYRLEPLPASGELAVHASGTVTSVVIDDGTLQTPLVADAGGATFRSPTLPAGTRIAIGIMANGPYDVMVDPGATGLRVEAGLPRFDLPLDLSFGLDATEVAAFEAAGQRVAGRITLVNRGADALDIQLDTTTSDPTWRVDLDETDVTVPPGASTEVRGVVVVPSQAWTDRPVRATVHARSDQGQVTAFSEVTPRPDAPLVEPFRWWSVPDDLLGGLDVASTGLGAVPLVSIDPVAEALLHDGIVALGSGMVANVVPPLTLTVDLAGDEPVPVAGTILDPTAGPGGIASTVRTFDLLLSLDGATYERVLDGEMTGALSEQAFLLPQPIPARFAQLRITSRFPGGRELRLGEWKVVASPGWTPSTGPLDVAAPAIGGHIAWFDPQVASPDMLDAMLVPDTNPPSLLGFDPRQTSSATWVMGFQDGRAAQVTELGWTDSPGSRPEVRLERVELATSLEGPLGPWFPLGTWELERDAAGIVAPFTLQAATWARYLRMSAPIRDPAAGVIELPDAISVFELGPSDDYRSVAAEWGYAGEAGPLEWQQPAPQPSSCLIGSTSGGAGAVVPLEPGTAVGGCLARGAFAHAYSFSVPPGQQTARFTVSGRPTVGVALRLLDETGVEVPMSSAVSGELGTVEQSAAVIPGVGYRLEVTQPPFSAVVLFDSSGSVGPYLPIMTSALRAYLGGIVVGEETLQLFDLEGPPLPEEFTDDAWLILGALDAHAGSLTGSSNAESGLIDGLDALAGRQGTRAIFLMTDADSGSSFRQAELWRWLSLVQPRLFTMQVAGSFHPQLHQQLMQDWAAVGAGAYDMTRVGGDIERAFDRMAAWVRRPAEYGLTMAYSPDAPPAPKPGSLRVVSDPNAPASGGDGGDPRAARSEADVAVEIVLDTSGSMLERLGRKRRIDVAKSVLARLVAEQLEPGTPVALRAFRQERRSCETELAVPLGPLEPTVLGATIESISIDKSVKTPLAAAIAAVADDLAAVTGPRIVIVVTDGAESCGGDPEAAVQSLIDRGFDVSVNVVGLGLDKKARRKISRLAAVGNGDYYDARDAAGLEKALKGALGDPYVVVDASGTEVARGTVDGPAVELPPGTYRVTLAGATASLDAVVIDSGADASILVPAAGS